MLVYSVEIAQLLDYYPRTCSTEAGFRCVVRDVVFKAIPISLKGVVWAKETHMKLKSPKWSKWARITASWKIWTHGSARGPYHTIPKFDCSEYLWQKLLQIEIWLLQCFQTGETSYVVLYVQCTHPNLTSLFTCLITLFFNNYIKTCCSYSTWKVPDSPAFIQNRRGKEYFEPVSSCSYNVLLVSLTIKKFSNYPSNIKQIWQKEEQYVSVDLKWGCLLF